MPARGKLLSKVKVLMGRSWSAMQQEDLDLWIVAHSLSPNLKTAFGCLYGDHPDTATKDVVAAEGSK